MLAGPEQVGGKADGLAWLARIGLAVPPWFVVPVATTERMLREGGAEAAIRAHFAREDPSPEALAALRAGVAAVRAPEALRGPVAAALAALAREAGTTRVAVRSSAVGEDGAEASFAGQYESFLNLEGPEAVLAAVSGCVASALSEHAVAYRLRHGLPADRLRMAVVVQAMVAGEVSGVLFTAHPTTGSRRHAVLSAALGLGEGVVSGRVDADTYVARLDGTGPVEAAVGPQEEAAVPDASGPDASGTRYVRLDPAPRTERVLADDAVRAIVAAGAAAAVRAGRPLDLEWTRAGGRVWFVQARPITALPPPQAGAGEPTVWDNSNIQESYAGVTTPLTFSFARRAYATVYRQTMRAVQVPEAEIAAHEPVLAHLLGLLRGRVYYNINNWYRGLLLLPGFGRNKADMEGMMGLQDPVAFVRDDAPPLPERLARAPRLALLAARLLRRFGRMDALVEGFHRDFRRAYDAVDRPTLHTRTVPELVALTRELHRTMLEAWSVPILNDFYVMMAGGRVRRALARAGFDPPDLALSGLLAGLDGIESTEPTRRLLALCDAVRRDPPLAALVAALPDDRLPAAVEAAHPAFWADCRAYLEAYGDRTAGELKLETVTPRERPALLFPLLRGLLARPDLHAGGPRAEAVALRQRTEREVEARLGGGPLGALRVRRFRAALDGFRRGIRHRESTRMQRTRMFGLYRSVYREIGRQLHGFGVLDAEGDVFYLTVEEVEDYVEGTAPSAALAAACRLRRAEFARYEAEEVPHHFITHGVPHAADGYRYPYEAALEAAARLTGTGCYPGVVEAPAAVVLDPSARAEVAGRILCAVRTDPGWAPLFPLAAGLLVERGSALSHSAVVARELGIPCVVGLPGLTRRVRTGDVLRMDGASGHVDLPEDA